MRKEGTLATDGAGVPRELRRVGWENRISRRVHEIACSVLRWHVLGVDRHDTRAANVQYKCCCLKGRRQIQHLPRRSFSSTQAYSCPWPQRTCSGGTSEHRFWPQREKTNADDTHTNQKTRSRHGISAARRSKKKHDRPQPPSITVVLC